MLQFKRYELVLNKIILILQALEESISKKKGGGNGSSLRILNPNKQILHIFTASAVVIE